MKIGIIGRSELTYESMLMARQKGHEITFIVTAKEAPEYKYTSQDFKDFANENNIPFVHDPKITASKLEDLIGETFPDICISVNYSGVISSEVIEMFPGGILNAHGGDLPKYRGNACQAWAIINGENRIGLCIHRMVGGELDSGDIIARSYKKINVNTRVGEVYDWMESQIPILFTEAIESLDADSSFVLERQSKNEEDALRCYPRLPEDGRVNWTNSPIEILRTINASSEPFSGAYCTYKGNKLLIWRAELFEDSEIFCGISGQVIHIDREEGFIIVIAGNGKLKITDVEYDNSRSSPDKVFNSIRARLK